MKKPAKKLAPKKKKKPAPTKKKMTPKSAAAKKRKAPAPATPSEPSPYFPKNFKLGRGGGGVHPAAEPGDETG